MRITPQIIEDICTKHNVKICTDGGGVYGLTRQINDLCVIGVLAWPHDIADILDNEEEFKKKIAQVIGVSMDYLESLEIGFEGCVGEVTDEDGYRDGKVIREYFL